MVHNLALRAFKLTLITGFAILAISAIAQTPQPALAPDAAPPAAEAAAPAPAQQPPPGDAGAQLFLQKCAGCHTIGKGKLTGPDLNVAATWQPADLDRTIKTMEAKVGPLPDDQIATLRDLLKAADVKDRIAAEETRAAAAMAAKFEPGSPTIGAALFTGKTPLANGGTACIACHTTNGRGGTLGPDLTGVFDKLGEIPLQSACEKTNFKIMAAAYRTHPVTKQEALHLAKYLESAGTAAPIATAPPPVAFVGLGAAALAVAGIGVLYRTRSAGTRKRLIRRHRDVVD